MIVKPEFKRVYFSNAGGDNKTHSETESEWEKERIKKIPITQFRN